MVSDLDAADARAGRFQFCIRWQGRVGDRLRSAGSAAPESNVASTSTRRASICRSSEHPLLRGVNRDQIRFAPKWGSEGPEDCGLLCPILTGQEEIAEVG